MRNKSDIAETRSNFDRLFKAMRSAEAELSRLNLAKNDLEKTCQRLDLEIGTGKTRLDKLIEAKDRLEVVTGERNRASEAYQKARDQFESYKSEVQNELFAAAVSMFAEIEPEHAKLVRRVTEWRSFVEFLVTHFISRRTRKLVGFRVGQSSVLPQSIFSEEDETAVDTIRQFIAGTLKDEITTVDDSTGTVSLARKKKVQVNV
jgi:hypothetical protein